MYLQNPDHPLLRTEGALLSVINKWRDRFGGKGGTLHTHAAQLYLFVPIPAKAKKLGLLSIYKFSLYPCIRMYTIDCVTQIL